jgi:phosphoribosylaminoimidazolecarboxamide formyltransferase/IMP cyclohydrolase
MHMTPQRSRPVKRALLSVSDKTGLVELARALAGLGIELVASGGTARGLREAGLEVVDVETLTGSPEMLGGRVKTLHPRIHGGVLARRDHEGDRADLAQHALQTIDLVVVNLYPFEATVARPGVSLADAIEKIDIGGPSMIRSAAKNHAYVGVVVDPADYDALVAELRQSGGLCEATRRRLAVAAFERTSRYDTAIHAYLLAQAGEMAAASAGRAAARSEPQPSGVEQLVGARSAPGASEVASPEDPFPPRLAVELGRAATLRYGENPHQRAALYGRFLEIAEPLHGRELSYNNLVDVQAALQLIRDFASADGAAVAILKHNTPCGVGLGATPGEAYRRAFETDPESPFGGIVVSSRSFDLDLARAVDEIFTEVLVAPGFDADALALLTQKKNRRLLRFHPERLDAAEPDLRRVFGGVLLQEVDAALEDVAGCRVASQRKPTEEELRALGFGWGVVKHVKSNAVVFAAADRTLGIGGGATSRVDAIHQAREKAARVGLDLRGSALASDAFFPFPDGLEVAAEAGATAIAEPGGSLRDDAVIEAADRLGIALVFTGVRHFRH